MATRKSVAVPAAGVPVRPAPLRVAASRLFGLELSPVATMLLGAAAVGVVLVGQLVEDIHDSPRLEMLPPGIDLSRWALVGLVLYIVVASVLLRRTWRRALAALRGVVRIEPEDHAEYERRLSLPEAWVDVLLLAVSGVMTVVLFAWLGAPMPIDSGQTAFLPPDALPALLVLAAYAVFGWAGLRLVYTTVRSARILRRLADEPLHINVFDTSNLEPFGNVALAVALAPAGIILILLAGLGTPTTVIGWTVLLLASSATVLALVVPLLGIHRRMSRAKDVAVSELGVRLTQLYEEVGRTQLTDGPTITRLRDVASTLIPLRATVQQMPAWPFRNTAAFGRAMLVASAPLIYATLNELIKIFWIQPLTR